MRIWSHLLKWRLPFEVQLLAREVSRGVIEEKLNPKLGIQGLANHSLIKAKR
jgi:hypothetical protein